jgi:hypothetical protein
MCKFGYADDPTYDQVSKNIIELINNALAGRKESEISARESCARDAGAQLEAFKCEFRRHGDKRSLEWNHH